MKAMILLGNGYEEVEALTVVDYLRRADISIDMVSITDNLLTVGDHGIQVTADKLLGDVLADDYDMVITPGGMTGSKMLASHPDVIRLLQGQKKSGRYIASICASPIALQAAGITSTVEGTSFPGVKDRVDFKNYREEVVVNDKKEAVISSRGPATAVYFALEIIRELKGESVASEIADKLLVPFVEAQIIKEYEKNIS